MDRYTKRGKKLSLKKKADFLIGKHHWQVIV